MPIIGIEPSEILSLRDEYLDFNEIKKDAEQIAKRAWMMDEYLIRPGKTGVIRLSKYEKRHHGKVLLHGHCYQKAQPPSEDGSPVGQQATKKMLEFVGYNVELIPSGCCGMAGAFGYEADHYDLSMSVGSLKLFPAINQSSPDTIICAPGVSCQAQIRDGTGRLAYHPIMLL
jgi:Fe-S oxidoreductase